MIAVSTFTCRPALELGRLSSGCSAGRRRSPLFISTKRDGSRRRVRGHDAARPRPPAEAELPLAQPDRPPAEVMKLSAPSCLVMIARSRRSNCAWRSKCAPNELMASLPTARALTTCCRMS